MKSIIFIENVALLKNLHKLTNFKMGTLDLGAVKSTNNLIFLSYFLRLLKNFSFYKLYKKIQLFAPPYRA